MKRLLFFTGILFFLLSCNSNSKNNLDERELHVGEKIVLEWGGCSLTEIDQSTYLSLQVKNWPEDGVLIIPGLNTRVMDVYAQKQPKFHFAWRFEKGDLQIHTSSLKDNVEIKVLLVKTKGKVKLAQKKLQ